MEATPNTPRGEEYRKKLHLTDRRKRVNARDIEGEPLLAVPKPDEERGSELHEFMRTMHRELGSQEEFIGIQLMGSNTRGHGNETSDIDTTIFLDSAGNPRAAEKIMAIFHQESMRLHQAGILKHKIQPHFFDLREDILRECLQNQDLEESENIELLYAAVLALCGLTVGPRVEEYRRKIGKMITDLPRERANLFMTNLVRFVPFVEGHSQNKREKRIERFSERNQTKAERARLMLWAKQIGRSLGISMGVQL